LDEHVEFRGTSRFQLKQRLGAGGMGVVYEVFDRSLSEAVALKTLRRMSAQALYRFKQEFRALADLRHPNLISLGELAVEEGLWFFTMELLHGVDFLSYVRASSSLVADSAEGRTVFDDVTRTDGAPALAFAGTITPESLPQEESKSLPELFSYAQTERTAIAGFDEPRLRDALRQLALGVAALHQAGKVHRDIKPSNVLVTSDGRVVLMDFGLVTEAEEERPRGRGTEILMVGTPFYMAPEQAANEPVGPAADWYAVGVMLFEALCGRLPFLGNAIQVLLAKSEGEAPEARAVAPEAPEDLSSLCAALLRRDPAARPTGEEILARLGANGPAPRQARGVFVGRAEELSALRAAFDESRRQAVAVFVLGESGLGKTALIRRFLAEARRDERAVVLDGRCYEQESVPYKALDGVVDALSRHLLRLNAKEATRLFPPDAPLIGRLFPVLLRVPKLAAARAEAPASPNELRARAFSALRELFARLADDRPVLLFIDDLQWADADGLLLLRELLAPPAPRLLLAATVRTSGGEPPPQLVGMDARRVWLRPLSRRDAEALAAAILPGEDAGSAALASESGGHPLFIDELARLRAEAGAAAAGDRARRLSRRAGRPGGDRARRGALPARVPEGDLRAQGGAARPDARHRRRGHDRALPRSRPGGGRGPARSGGEARALQAAGRRPL
jgi:eukaryotic-like serine/threonine-protein kinase